MGMQRYTCADIQKYMHGDGHILTPSGAHGMFVLYADALERERVLREALIVARRYVVSHSPAALVSEVKQIDAALAQ